MVDYDKKKFDADAYGNLYPKTEKKYLGYRICLGLGNVKVWDSSDNFFGMFPDVKSARQAIRSSKK